MEIYKKESKDLQLYQNNNLKIYYKLQDKEVIKDMEQAILEGCNKAIEYFEIKNYDKDIIVYVYSSIEELHLDVFGEKREEWEVCCGDGKNTLKIVSPANSGKIHDYKTMLEILSKCVADLILEDKFPNVPNWFDITTYITELSTEKYTYSKPSIIKFKNKNYFNYSDSYFIARYIAETFGKDIVLEILKNPDKYNEILKLSDEEIDAKIEKYYAKEIENVK